MTELKLQTEKTWIALAHEWIEREEAAQRADNKGWHRDGGPEKVRAFIAQMQEHISRAQGLPHGR